MSNYIELDSVCAELDALFDDFSKAFEKKDVQGCESALCQYFSKMRNADGHGALPEAELSNYANQWGASVSKLSELSPHKAFFSTHVAWELCHSGAENLPCHPLIINTVALCMNSFAYSALNEYAAVKKTIPLERSAPYIGSLSNVLMTLAPHIQSPYIEETFYEALTKFEDILFSVFVPPTERYKYVKKIRDYAEENSPRADKLLIAMDDLLSQYSVMLPNGQGTIQHPLEAQADKLAQESKKWFESKKPVAIEDARALRASVSTYQKIEESLERKNFSAAEDNLYNFFHQLSKADSKDLSSCHLLAKAVSKLAIGSLKNAFQLVSRCIQTIENEPVSCEPLETIVFEFAVPIIADWECRLQGDYTTTHPLNLAIMKRTSEFSDQAQAKDIFGVAVVGYQKHLESLPYAERHGQLWEMADWLSERQWETSLLGNFFEKMSTEDMMGIKSLASLSMTPPKASLSSNVHFLPSYTP